MYDVITDKWAKFTNDEIIELRRGLGNSTNENMEYDVNLVLVLIDELNVEIKRRNLKYYP